MKLIKINDGHYVVVDDSEIKEGVFVFRKKDNNIFIALYTDELSFKDCQAITHTTLEYYYQHGVKPLSLSEVEEAINGYSVEKMADEFSQTDTFADYSSFIEGFNAHKELVKDKLFTVEDIKKILYAFEIYDEEKYYASDVFDEVMKQFLPKTEWDVEFDEQNKLKLI